MGIDDIHLSYYLYQRMFAGTLVGSKKDNEVKTTLPEVKFSSLGGNNGKILFLVNNDQYPFLSDDEMILLSSLLTACKISMADIALVNVYQYPATDYNQLNKAFDARKTLLFGVATSDVRLPFTVPLFQIHEFEERVYLTCPPLRQFINNKKLKQELWTCLQKIFLS